MDVGTAEQFGHGVLIEKQRVSGLKPLGGHAEPCRRTAIRELFQRNAASFAGMYEGGSRKEGATSHNANAQAANEQANDYPKRPSRMRVGSDHRCHRGGCDG